MKKYKSLRGIRDITGREAELFNEIIRNASGLLESYGYSRIFLPVIEHTSLFARGIGEDTDIVSKEMYSFKDKKGRDISLRPEGTAGAVRAMIEEGQFTGRVRRKIYYFGPMFRYERPQKGRYRQFYQLGCEIYGQPSPRQDAEIIELAGRLLEMCGVSGYRLLLNSVGCSKDRAEYIEEIKKILRGRENELCNDCRRRLETNTMRILDCKKKDCREIYSALPTITGFLCENCSEYMDKLREILTRDNIKYINEPGLVRGLDYYTGPVFEFEIDSAAIIAGGRYDGLVKELGGPSMPACGWALGMERLAAVSAPQTGLPVKAAVIKVTGGKVESCRGIANILRERGFMVFEDYEDISAGNKFKIADKNGIEKVLIIGGEEERAGTVTFRDMKTGRQEPIPVEDTERLVRKINA